MKHGIAANQGILTMLQTMKYRNLGNSLVEVELLSDDVEIRIGETKWAGVAYMRQGKSKVYVRTKAEFKAKFVLIDAKP
jgi:hypothetical protein